MCILRTKRSLCAMSQRHDGCAACLEAKGVGLAVQDFATKQKFMPAERVYHADDQAVAQYYIALADQYSTPSMLSPTQKRFDTVVDNPSSVDLDHSVLGAPPIRCRRAPAGAAWGGLHSCV